MFKKVKEAMGHSLKKGGIPQDTRHNAQSHSTVSLILKSVALIKHLLKMNIFKVFKVVMSATTERKLLSRGLC